MAVSFCKKLDFKIYCDTWIIFYLWVKLKLICAFLFITMQKVNNMKYVSITKEVGLRLLNLLKKFNAWKKDCDFKCFGLFHKH